MFSIQWLYIFLFFILFQNVAFITAQLYYMFFASFSAQVSKISKI